jgi:hypothetical protein
MSTIDNDTISIFTFRVVTLRPITRAEVAWLPQGHDTIPAGTELFVQSDAYGVCAPSEILVSLPGDDYGFGIPADKNTVIGIQEA